MALWMITGPLGAGAAQCSGGKAGVCPAEKRTDDSEPIPWCLPVVDDHDKHDEHCHHVHHSNATASDRELIKGMQEVLRVVKNTPRVEKQLSSNW